MNSVWQLFERAITRPRNPVPETSQRVTGDDGAWVVFALTLKGDRIETAEYRCATCATLVAACEAIHLAAPGMAVHQAAALTAAALLERVPGVPASRHHRFALAVEAFRQAVRHAGAAV